MSELSKGNQTIVYNALAGFGKPVTTKVIQKITGLKSSTPSVQIMELRRKGLAECLGRDSEGSPLWIAHPLSAPLNPPQEDLQGPKKRKSRVKKEPDSPTVIINRIIDDMVRLDEAIKQVEQTARNELMERIKAL